MSRLFYERAAGAARSGGEKSGTRIYCEKVAQLIPGEVLAAYLTMIGLTAGINSFSQQAQDIIVWCVFAAGLILTPLYLNYMANTDEDKDKPRARHLIVSTLAFVVWAYQVSGDRLIEQWYDANLASIVLILFTLISGLIPLGKGRVSK